MQKSVVGFDKSGGLPILATHTFATSEQGELLHIIDGRLRATVPPEGWADYVRDWPEAGEVVDSMRRVPVVVAIEPAPVAAPVEVAQEQTDKQKIAMLEAALAAAQAAAAAVPAADPVEVSNEVAV